MRKLKRPHKNLFVLEAGFIYCKRRNVDYDSDKFIDEVFMTLKFNLG